MAENESPPSQPQKPGFFRRLFGVGGGEYARQQRIQRRQVRDQYRSQRRQWEIEFKRYEKQVEEDIERQRKKLYSQYGLGRHIRAGDPRYEKTKEYVDKQFDKYLKEVERNLHRSKRDQLSQLKRNYEEQRRSITNNPMGGPEN